MYKLKSRDKTQVFEMTEWFYDAFHQVNLSLNKWAYMQHQHTGCGRQEMFDNNYTYEVGVMTECFANYANYKHAVVKDLISAQFYPTWCNHSVSVWLEELGNSDLARMFKNNDANKCAYYLNILSQHFYTGVSKIYAVSNLAATVANKLTIAIQSIKDGIGHTAPIIGEGTDDKTYTCNKGAIQNDGIVDLKTAFGNMKDICFYEVYGG